MFIAAFPQNILQPLIDACEAVLKFWHDLLGDFDGSWGWSIILLTFTVRIIILPLTFKGVKSMQRLQTLQPEIKRIQERYKDDKQRMNQEIMAFYQREKVNPLGSCMPLLLQIPFFISLFYLLRSDSFKADIEGNEGFGPIEDLAEKVTDPVLLGALIVLLEGRRREGRGFVAGRRQRRAEEGAASLAAQEEEALGTAAVSDDLTVEASGESLGEAKWAAMKQLEPRFPGITAECVRFEVLEEPDAGGAARVRGEVDEDAWRAAAEVIPEEPAERVRAVVARVVHALGLQATVDVEETEDEIRATVNGEDLGLMIGKHGSTIDAVQHLAFRAAFRGRETRKQVTVDAAGYRERRETALHRMADRAAAEALRYDRAVELEPMRAQERKIVHTYLGERTDVETHSEGDEPDRRLVISPVRAFREP